MSYTFKKLAEVEEIQEAPETAKAFVEVDGEVKRAPYGAGGAGGGVNLDELRFDLDIEQAQDNYVNFTNMDQIKKVLDNDMNIIIIYRNSSCCSVSISHTEYFRCNTTAKLSSNKAVIPSLSDSYNEYSGAITVTFATEERLAPVSARYRKSSGEILAAYATI